jgi:uncharacterized coiled-coil protein SlyX
VKIGSAIFFLALATAGTGAIAQTTAQTMRPMTINPAMRVANPADTVELLKQLNTLQAQVAAQQATIDELKSLVATARNDIQAADGGYKKAVGSLNESVSNLNSGQVALKNQFVTFKTQEYDVHRHKLMGGVAGNGVSGGQVMLKADPGDLGETVKKLATTSKPFVQE